MESKNLIIGRCFCGAIKYEVERPLKFIAHDHCSICCRISGAAFVTWAGTKENQFKLLAGADNISSFKTTAEAERQFCKTCGSHLFFRSTRWPDEVHFTVATVTSDFVDQPKSHVFFSDKAKWIDIHDELPRYGGKTGVEPINE